MRMLPPLVVGDAALHGRLRAARQRGNLRQAANLVSWSMARDDCRRVEQARIFDAAQVAPRMSRVMHATPFQSQKYKIGSLWIGWGTWIRTKTNRVRVCCATVTPFPNGLLSKFNSLRKPLGHRAADGKLPPGWPPFYSLAAALGKPIRLPVRIGDQSLRNDRHRTRTPDGASTSSR